MLITDTRKAGANSIRLGKQRQLMLKVGWHRATWLMPA
jgi:hypothetical protein